ncbi:MAG: hypothetical protein R3B91_05965 [Planctomycetaceae bacterium]
MNDAFSRWSSNWTNWKKEKEPRVTYGRAVSASNTAIEPSRLWIRAISVAPVRNWCLRLCESSKRLAVLTRLVKPVRPRSVARFGRSSYSRHG